MSDLVKYTPIEPWESFQKSYLEVRQCEGRILSDDDVAKLPNLPNTHPHHKEWQLRLDSVNRLKRSIKSKFPNGGNLLEVGCGNGWLSNQLSNLGFEVTGIDVNLIELEQAKRVFTDPNLKFAFADVMHWEPESKFDAVVFSAVLQYFEKPNAVLKRMLAKYGAKSIFIADTAFYEPSEKSSAKARTRKYYQSTGVNDMANHYHHHSLDELNVPFEMIYRPSMLGKWLGKSPFPIVEVTAE